MRHGVKVYVNGSMADAIDKARKLFNTYEHLEGLDPVEVHFPPGELPDVPIVMGLVVVADELLDPGAIRVTTAPMDAGQELEVEKELFNLKVEELVR